MPITISVSSSKAATANGDLLVLPVYQRQVPDQRLPAAARRDLAAALRPLKFKGEWARGEILVAPRGLRAKFVAVVGLGDKRTPNQRQAEGLRRGLAKAVQDGRRHLLRTVALDITAVQSPAALAAAAVEAAELVNYHFTTYAKRLAEQQAARSLRRLVLLAGRSHQAAVRQAIKQAQVVLAGVTMTRDLVNQPAAAMSPTALVAAARRAAGASRGAVTVKVLNRAAAAQQGFSAFLAVARGSQEEPYVIHLTYKPYKRAKAAKKIFLVGKGVTFDSGGLSLKPAEAMETMKIDMAGAATVIGLFSILPKLAVAAEVHGIIATCENMPSGTAYRPGDILTAKNGKTIEVLNTDAEGRIILADALSYAAEHKPDAVIDLATLTGACMVALGETYAGLWSTDRQLKQSLLAAAAQAGEGLVALPLPEEYKPFIESQVADVRNVATNRYGGAITAALFLREFVNDTPWAHLDIAGPVYNERVSLPYYGHGATGYGVRTLAEFLKAV